MIFEYYGQRSVRGLFGRVQTYNCANYDNYVRSGRSCQRCAVYNVSVLGKPVIRYTTNHIGLGTKRFVDSLGSC